MSRQYWFAAIPFAIAKVSMLLRGHHSSDEGRSVADEAAGRDIEMATGEMQGGENLTPPSLPQAATASTSDGDQQTQPNLLNGWGDITKHEGRRLLQQVLGWMKEASSAAKIRFRGIWMAEEHTWHYTEDGGKHLKPLYEYTKNTISFESVMLAALCNRQSYRSHSKAFKISFAMLLFGFFTDLVTALLLLISSTFPIKYLIYASSLSQMLMPFSLLVSSGELHPYMILAVPLLFVIFAFLHRVCPGAGAVPDAKTLGRIFDISSGIYALAAGCALTSPIFVSREYVVASTLAFSLFLTIFIARYLMLISTLRPPAVVRQAQALTYLLKFLLALTVIFIAVEFLGPRFAFVAISVGIIDAALTFVHSPRTTAGYRSKDRELLSAGMVIILFSVLIQIHSEHAATPGASLGSAAMLRLVLYFVAFLWSLNRMLIPLAGVAVGGGIAVKVWSALEWVRASVVVVAVVDMVYKFGITLIRGTS